MELPLELKSEKEPVIRKSRWKTGFWSLIILIPLFGLLVLWAGQPENEDRVSLPAVPELNPGIPTEDQVDDFPNIPFFTTPWVEATSTHSLLLPRTCGHELDAAFGAENRFVLHRIAVGENLNLYANRYQTAVNAILYINHDMQMPIWENMVIVIPVGTTLVIGTPPFEVIEQEKMLISTDRLAERFDTDAQQFRRYNEFDDSCVEFSGWILIPRKRNGT